VNQEGGMQPDIQEKEKENVSLTVSKGTQKNCGSGKGAPVET